ncbi:MAG: hypothetical protein AAGM46_26905 [Cyanobacteria bacterium J06582_2]
MPRPKVKKVPAAAVISDVDVEAQEDSPLEEEEQQQQEETASVYPRPPPAKKQYRVSHRAIQDFIFDEDQRQVLVDFIKENPCLYDKQDKEWSNHRTKQDLWMKCAELFPGSDYLQCRKFFEQKRTAFGKIEAREQKSGAAKRPRTARDEEIMRTWAFLGGHIAHAQTLSSARFSTDHESSSDASGLSGASIQRRRMIKKKRSGNGTPKDTTNEEEHQPEERAILTALLERATAINPPQKEEPSCGQYINSFSKMVAFQMTQVDPDDMDQAMIDVQVLLSKYVAKKKSRDAAKLALPSTSTSAAATSFQTTPVPSTPSQWVSARPMQPVYQQMVPYGVPSSSSAPSTSGYQPQYLQLPPGAQIQPPPIVSPSKMTSYLHHVDSLSSLPSIPSIPSIASPALNTLLNQPSSPFPSASSTLNTPRPADEED